MIGMTLCSGIGAPEVAAPWVDWRLASEIEKFPRAVLQHRLGYKEPAEQCPDGPQYKALGNSMATVVVKYIMDRMRISMAEKGTAQ